MRSGLASLVGLRRSAPLVGLGAARLVGRAAVRRPFQKRAPDSASPCKRRRESHEAA